MTAQPFKTILLDLLHQGNLEEKAFVENLNENERSAIGTMQTWSAKDHIAHRTFWHQQLVHKFTAIQNNQEVSSEDPDVDQSNAIIFEQQKLRSWSDIKQEYDQVYTQLITHIEQLTEEDLTVSRRFSSISGKHPLYAVLLGIFYEHDQEHIAQYYRDHNQLPQAIHIREKCANSIRQAQLPDWVKAFILYNLADFYAQLNNVEKATSTLQEAITLNPALKDRSQQNPNLSTLPNPTPPPLP